MPKNGKNKKEGKVVGFLKHVVGGAARDTGQALIGAAGHLEARKAADATGAALDAAANTVGQSRAAEAIKSQFEGTRIDRAIAHRRTRQAERDTPAIPGKDYPTNGGSKTSTPDDLTNAIKKAYAALGEDYSPTPSSPTPSRRDYPTDRDREDVLKSKPDTYLHYPRQQPPLQRPSSSGSVSSSSSGSSSSSSSSSGTESSEQGAAASLNLSTPTATATTNPWSPGPGSPLSPCPERKGETQTRQRRPW